MNFFSLLTFERRHLVRRVNGVFVKVNFKMAFPKGKKLPSFTKGSPFQRRLSETGPRYTLVLMLKHNKQHKLSKILVKCCRDSLFQIDEDVFNKTVIQV